ncbi:MAG: TIGR02206 family membrane protein [Candidatus Marinimicrobia bacterium]|nr:TIGR02206 family membrane protein [Candidatus Neomarinimicrobiota bacterium]MDP7436984.1 TIGR02206 family membrane protein [Candidatus Neomarinimicrobiota bacterium]HJL75576.1 TIGR02206 family membrane protein [Candidatus Neomarinimicrobiota bacterium]
MESSIDVHQKLQGLQLFDALHVSYLLAWLVIWIAFPIIGKKLLNADQHKTVVWAMLAFMVGQEVIDYWNRAQVRDLNLVLDLPLHFCHLSLFFAICLLIKPSKYLYEITYFWGLGGAFQSMLAPDMNGFDNYLGVFLFYAHHAMIILVCLWLAVIDGYRCRKGAILRTMIFSNIVIWPVWLIDWLVGANYMYLMERPPTESPLVFGEWPWYIINVEMVAFFIIMVINLPMIYLRRMTLQSESAAV